MKANELRIGNYVDLFGMTATVQADDFNMTEHGIAIEQGKPIPLTEEWLKRLGATKNRDTTFYIEEINWLELNGDIWDVCLVEGYTITQIQYVHQLQNLYFALTGDELKIIQK